MLESLTAAVLILDHLVMIRTQCDILATTIQYGVVNNNT